MTKAYALRKLLEHEPMTLREIVQCTRWSELDACAALRACQRNGVVKREPRHGACGQRAPSAYKAVRR